MLIMMILALRYSTQGYTDLGSDLRPTRKSVDSQHKATGNDREALARLLNNSRYTYLFDRADNELHKGLSTGSHHP
jgi:hypothetical protein